MGPKSQRRYRQQMIKRMAELERADIKTRSDRATVILDQQSVGRLSRLDLDATLMRCITCIRGT